VETVTVAAARPSAFSLPEMEMLVGSVVLVIVIAWMLFARVRRDRHQPHA
jgi:hypothetical protein